MRGSLGLCIVRLEIVTAAIDTNRIHNDSRAGTRYVLLVLLVGTGSSIKTRIVWLLNLNRDIEEFH